MKYIIDRLEEGLAICEKRTEGNDIHPLAQLPKAIKKGI